MDVYDTFIDRCENWKRYPRNLLRPNQLRSALDRYRQHLDENEKRLFIPDLEKVCFFEISDGDDAYSERCIENSDDLRGHLGKNQKDPRSRFIFIRSLDSRSELKCSRQSLSYAFSFHQVPSSFLDFVHSFGSTYEPTDYHMSGFQCDDTLGAAADDLVTIPRLGRSGREHRMQYLLRSVEPSIKTHDGSRTWNIRQMAVYHSYDVVNGKALWINIKTNDSMRDKIKEATSELSGMGPDSTLDRQGSFSATFKTHIIHFEWCDENWRQCINDIEAQIRKTLVKAKTARIDRKPKWGDTPAIKQAITVTKSHNTTDDSFIKPPPAKGVCSFLKQWLPFESLQERTASLPKDSMTEKTFSKIEDEFKERLDCLMVLDSFTFSEMQTLHHLGEQLESFRLVMELNQRVLRDTVEHYRDLISRDEFPSDIKNRSRRDLTLFSQRMERIGKNLEIRVSQVKSLAAWLEDGKSLFDGILQYQNVQVGRIFTESSQIQQGNMEEIAHKTEKETISMHIITFVTLFFLPGTFLAAFFQSGLVEINMSAKGIKDAVIFHETAFRLFATICFPLMLLTFSLWVVLFRWFSSRGSTGRKSPGDEAV